MDAGIISSLLQAGTGGIVIVVVIIFLNFLKDERASRTDESKRFTEALAKRDEEYEKRNDALCENLTSLTRQVTAMTERLIEHDAKINHAPVRRKE